MAFFELPVWIVTTQKCLCSFTGLAEMPSNIFTLFLLQKNKFTTSAVSEKIWERCVCSSLPSYEPRHEIFNYFTLPKNRNSESWFLNSCTAPIFANAFLSGMFKKVPLVVALSLFNKKTHCCLSVLCQSKCLFY